MVQPNGSEDAAHALAEPALQRAMLSAAVLTSLISIPFWHAPALVHWGGQTVGQALFSSTLAVWRSKAAMTIYGLAWIGVLMAMSVLLSAVASMTESPGLATFLAMLFNLVVSSAFYVSLLFTFNDSFGSASHAA
jgi:hypothetical protein